jgi:GNAT superfamily N-acetyltransferase
VDDRYEFHTATLADAAELAATVYEGFLTYKGFAPSGWRPMPIEQQVALMRESLGRADAWCVLARSGAEPAGHVAWLAASASRSRPNPDPTLAHLWQLFVRGPHLGTGLAAELVRRALASARERGYTRMRLYTPSGQARARRFYEREGFSLEREVGLDANLGLAIVEYRRAV